MAYQSKYTGTEIDEAIGKVSEIETMVGDVESILETLTTGSGV